MVEQKNYYGEWWFPNTKSDEKSNRSRGTLTIEDNGLCQLELFDGLTTSNLMRNLEVLWGIDNRNRKYTLFGIVWKQWGATIKYNIQYVLEGMHIASLDTPLFNECYTEYPYLREWTETRLNEYGMKDNMEDLITNVGKDTTFFQGEIDGGIRYLLNGRNYLSFYESEVRIINQTYLHLTTERKCSIRNYFTLIREFSQFISLAQYNEQHPSKINFKNNEDDSWLRLHYNVKPSYKPYDYALIRLSDLKDRIPSLINQYHSVYDAISPLVKYLLTSIHADNFDAPDFLIVAQALEGYFKRFINRTEATNLKDKRKVEEIYKAIIEHFRSIDAVNKCNINTNVLKASRNFYTHLYINEPNAVSGTDLIILTQKCIVLLTCCILDQIGMTADEINKAFNISVIRNILYNVEFFEKKKITQTN